MATTQSPTPHFSFKEIDQEGLHTLEVIAHADKFNRWMYETIKPHCVGNILEIGSGIGNISRYFLEDKQTITVSDVRHNYCAILEQKFAAKKPYLKNIVLLNLVAPDFERQFSGLLGTFDSIFALNVVEHIENDSLAIQNCYKLLKKGGKLVILVPAYQTLYNNLDKQLEHYRRYTQSSLNQLFIQSRFSIIHKQYFNFVGMFGWFFTGKILKKDDIPEGQMGLYNTLVPIIRLIDKLVGKKMGLSVISVGEK